MVDRERRAAERRLKGDVPAVELVTRDNDSIDAKVFDPVFEDRGMRVRRLAIRAPNTNAYVERFIQSLQVECLDHFLVFGEKHLDYLVREYVEHYHEERPHQGLGNRRVNDLGPPGLRRQGNEAVLSLASGVLRRTRLGGLLTYYHRGAA